MAMKAAGVLQRRDATGGQCGLVFVPLQEVRARGAAGGQGGGGGGAAQKGEVVSGGRG